MLLVAGCAHRTDTRLTVDVRTGEVHRYHVRCSSAGNGRPALACRALARHPRLMLFPARMRSTCIGGYGFPAEVVVSGATHGRRVGFGYRECDLPSGPGAWLWFAALENPAEVGRAEIAATCVERTARAAGGFSRIAVDAVQDCVRRAHGG